MKTAQHLLEEDTDPMALTLEEERVLGTKVIYTAWVAVAAGFVLPPLVLILRMGGDVWQQWSALLRVSISSGVSFAVYALLLLVFITMSVQYGRVVVRQRYERMATGAVLMMLFSGMLYTFPDKPLTVVGSGVGGYLFVGFATGYLTLMYLQMRLREE
jgi:hypothetical protein